MKYVLLAAFLIGLLLFVLSWLRVVFAGFRHHFVTGLVSAIPVVNLLVLPSLWHRVYAWVIAGILGFFMAIAAWYAGAEQHTIQFISDSGIQMPRGDLADNPAALATESKPTPPEIPIDTSIPGEELPKTALYQINYQEIDVRSLAQHIDSYVRITRIDRKRFEAKILGITAKGVLAEYRESGKIVEQTIDFDDIISAEAMKQ